VRPAPIASRATRRRAFFTIVAAQFFGSLADNALLIVSIGLLIERGASGWMTPALRLFFYASYVVLAPFAGAVADALPKTRVILVTNLVKLAGCALLIAHVHPLLAYALIGAGAAAHGPARYGILSELLPSAELVAANAWIEVATVVSILLGVALGSLLMEQSMPLPALLGSRAATATLLLASLYAIAAACVGRVRAGASANPAALSNPSGLVREFGRCMRVLWRDPQGRLSLAVTSLFWSASAVLQFIVLRWAAFALHLSLAQAALLQGAVAVGMVAGAIAAARWVPLSRAASVLPLGIAIGALVLSMPLIESVWLAVVVLIATGALSGLLVVPMNALLQHRGNQLMDPGQSIAVQNFNESLASLVLLAVYGALMAGGMSLMPTIVLFGVAVSIAMLAILAWRRATRIEGGFVPVERAS
jgi:LPLT family lysophospholipid transporter-like MFS transporter